jgi:hypothetical protein
MAKRRCSLCTMSRADTRGVVVCGLDNKPGWIKNYLFDCEKWVKAEGESGETD